MYYLETGNEKQTRFRNAVLLALAVHAALILFVSFNASNAKSYKTPQIEVTLVSQPSATASDQARQIAQANQEGSGDESEINQISTRNNLQTNTPFVQQAQLQAPQKQVAQQRTAVATTAMARRNERIPPVVVTIDGPGIKIVDGKKRILIPAIQGLATQTATWIIQSDKPVKIEVKAETQTAWRDTRVVDLRGVK